MQKRAVRNISLKEYNSHTDPIFRKLEILKFYDLVKFNTCLFMFKISLNLHPSTICELFPRLDNFSRNVSYRENKIRYEYQNKIVPNCQIKYWNKLDLGLKNCIKEMPNGVNNKMGNKPNNFTDTTFYNFKVNNFKKSYSETLIYEYKEKVNCNNPFCKDCG